MASRTEPAQDTCATPPRSGCPATAARRTGRRARAGASRRPRAREAPRQPHQTIVQAPSGDRTADSSVAVEGLGRAPRFTGSAGGAAGAGGELAGRAAQRRQYGEEQGGSQGAEELGKSVTQQVVQGTAAHRRGPMCACSLPRTLLAGMCSSRPTPGRTVDASADQRSSVAGNASQYAAGSEPRTRARSHPPGAGRVRSSPPRDPMASWPPRSPA